MITSIIIIYLSVEQVHSHTNPYTAMKFLLDGPKFDVHCSYAKLKSDQTFKALGIRKNGANIAELLSDGNFTMTPKAVRDVEWIVKKGGDMTVIQISIMNYRGQTFENVWECRVNYTSNGGTEHFETTQFKLKYQGDIFENSNRIEVKFRKNKHFRLQKI